MIARLAILFLLCWQASAAAADMRVLVVQSDSSALYQSFAKTYAGNLPASVRLSVLERAEDYNGETADLIVTVGVKAAEWVAGRSAQPQLAAMIPSNSELTAKHSRRLAAIYLDQPWSRQVGLLRAALPDGRS